MLKSDFLILGGVFILLSFFTACLSSRDVLKQSDVEVDTAGQSGISGTVLPSDLQARPHPQQIIPPVIIYKTKGDYREYVPVSLSPDGKTLRSYPGIGDIYYQGVLAVPTLLEGGFLLDNRGIDTNTVFLDYTYLSYSQLPETPVQEELLKHVMTTRVVEVLYSCKCSRDTAILNEMIRNRSFERCVRIK